MVPVSGWPMSHQESDSYTWKEVCGIVSYLLMACSHPLLSSLVVVISDNRLYPSRDKSLFLYPNPDLCLYHGLCHCGLLGDHGRCLCNGDHDHDHDHGLCHDLYSLTFLNEVIMAPEVLGSVNVHGALVGYYSVVLILRGLPSISI